MLSKSEDQFSQVLLQSLLELQVIDEQELRKAYEQSLKSTISFQEYILEKDLIPDEHLGSVIADIYGLRFVHLASTPIDYKVLEMIPEMTARSMGVVAFALSQQEVQVAADSVLSIQAKSFLERKFSLPVVQYYATSRDVEGAFALYTREFQKSFDDLISKNIEKISRGSESGKPIIEIVDTIVEFAFQNRASDIHIEPMNDYTMVRYRIDGLLQDVTRLPKEIHDQIVLRVKVMAKLRIDEHSSTQDGKIEFQRTVIHAGENKVDLRVSIVPITDGEKVVIRVLSENSRQFALKDLGFSANDTAKIKEIFEKPYGMILATGPTGSGKTTTLYAILKLLNTRDVNITTIEDPVEYDIEGINQIQVNEQTGITFAKGLRSIVRQDPDVILVGEIRDEETADIAVNSALTGHLVLSTLHTNDAATALPRLLDMGIEPFLVSSTVSVVVAQRLVRKLCQNCRFSVESKIAEISGFSEKQKVAYFGVGDTVRLYDGKGCDVCHHTKYQGRIGIFEVMVISDAIRKAIVEQSDSSTITGIAVSEGMQTLFDNGIEKVKSGETTLEEVFRVVKQ